MQDMIKRIGTANSDELSRFIGAVIHRYGVLHPDWEVVFYSIHRRGELREMDIRELMHMLEKELNAKKDSLG